MTPQARSPEWVRQQPQYAQAKEAMESAQHASLRATEVTDEATCARAAEILVQVRNSQRAIDKNRLAAGEPYRKSQAAINAEYKELEGALSGIADRLAQDVSTFENLKAEEEAERRREYEEQVREQEVATRRAAAKRVADAEQAAAAARAAEAAGHAPPEPPAPPAPPTPAPPPLPPPPPPRENVVRRTSGGSVSGRLEWKFEIEDPELVPDKYKPIDETILRKDVKAGVRDIPGVRIFQERNLTTRGKA